MPKTLANVRKSARRWMRDTRPGNYAIGTRELNRIIEAMTHDVDSDLDAGQAWIASAITLNPATSPPDYLLPTSSEYQNVLDLRRASDGFILWRRSAEQIDQMRWSKASATASKVSAYALRQSAATSPLLGAVESITVMFDVRPSEADTIDLKTSTTLAAMLDNDDAFVPFQRDFVESFERGVAAMAIEMMRPEDQQARGFTGSVSGGRYAPSLYVAGLQVAYEKGLKKERIRLIRLELSDSQSYLKRSEAE